MAKHSKQPERRKVIQLKDHLPQRMETPSVPERDFQEEAPQAEFEYEDRPGSKKKKQIQQIPKAFYRISVVLIVAALGLAIWVNKDNLTPDRMLDWLRVQVTGGGEGDGYPVAITGSSVTAGNFLSTDGNAVSLSDTSLTVLGPSGQELLSLRHSFNQPMIQATNGKYLLYNQGSTGYMVVSGTEVKVERSASKDILTGAISSNGRFALATQGQDGASDFTVYLVNGETQFTYSFSQGYITSVALNGDGTRAMVCTVRSQGGELISKITVFDLNQPEPVGEYETRDNLLMESYWGDNGVLYAIGDNSLVRGKWSDLSFSEYSYDGKAPTAFQCVSNRVYLSISAYQHAGACTLLVFRGMEEPVEIPVEERVQALSVFGGTVGALVDQYVVLYDSSSGNELARSEAGSDAKSIALSNESTVYVLGVSEIRRLEF